MTTDSQGAPLHVTHIEIGKDRFQIQTDLTDAELSAIVDYVTNKMQAFARADSCTNFRKPLLLMALEITSELFDMRQRHAKYKNLYIESQKIAGVLASMLDDKLAEFNNMTNP